MPESTPEQPAPSSGADASSDSNQQPGPASEGAVHGEVVDAAADSGPPPDRETITEPQKLLRIASMVRNMLDEVRRAPLDDAGRRHLSEIHKRSLAALEDVLSEDLRNELADVVIPFAETSPSDSELRIAQAQLVGWLEGLFHGIQATLFSQQAVAQAQFEEMRRRHALESGEQQEQQPGSRNPLGYL